MSEHKGLGGEVEVKLKWDDEQRPVDNCKLAEAERLEKGCHRSVAACQRGFTVQQQEVKLEPLIMDLIVWFLVLLFGMNR